jgi:DNA-binding beta-propeller fold protein YncE
MDTAGIPISALLVGLMAMAPASAQPLELVATIEMPGVKGRIDHFTVDLKGQRLFMAALGNDTVEVLDIAANRHVRSLKGFKEPQGVGYLPEGNRLFVANGEGGRLDVLDAGSFAVVKRVQPLDDADNVRLDAAAGTLIVGYGSGALRMINAQTHEALADIRLAGHPESFQLEAGGARVFVNVPTAHQIAVADRAKRQVVATWAVTRAGRNFPMALDEGGRRLFVGARSPALLLVYDIDAGKLVTTVPIGGDTDDLFFDRERKRLYVVCGEGRVDVLRPEGADRYAVEASIKTAPRARTGLFVPEMNKLFVAAPLEGSAAARVLVYQVK